MYEVEKVRKFLEEIGMPGRRLGKFRAYRFPKTTVGPSNSVGDVPITFKRDVVCLSLRGQVVSDTPSATDDDYALSEFRLRFGSQEDLFDNGKGQAVFAPYLETFGRTVKGEYVLKRPRYAEANLSYTAFFNNNSSGKTMTFSLAVEVIELMASDGSK